MRILVAFRFSLTRLQKQWGQRHCRGLHGEDIPNNRTIFFFARSEFELFVCSFVRLLNCIHSGHGVQRGEIIPAPRGVDFAATALAHLHGAAVTSLDGVPVAISELSQNISAHATHIQSSIPHRTDEFLATVKLLGRMHELAEQ